MSDKDVRAPRSRKKRWALAAAGALAVTGALAATPLVGGAAAAEGPTCSSLHLVIARGTTEFGPYGFIVGDNLFPAVKAKVPDATAAAVDYPANFDASSPRLGNQAVVDHLTTRSAQCPNERYALVGYSQGAQIVNAALGVDTTGTINGSPPVAVLPQALNPRIASIVFYGNPLKSVSRPVPPAFQDRVLDNCAGGDPVCEAGAFNIIAHLSYGLNGDIARGADFIAAHP
ncbi:cutinase family protein [Actinokineospora spheciospongiae]|uniref:cutinase family protein n=1 Tax=Actinokineospora spheciospongiae TaxID=909613 RepID=UPI000D71D4EF|nr:cutinase family protein [Actinokineospora spheciospongiae]PWW55554.1 cutinase [Actinokineospora spheciospongiae]